MISGQENEISSTRISLMAASTSNNNLGVTITIHREKDTREGSDAESLTTHKNQETAPNQVAISAVCSSPALSLNNYALNKDNSADTGNNPAEVILKCPHCNTVSESQSEIVIHIREKHETRSRKGVCSAEASVALCNALTKNRTLGFLQTIVLCHRITRKLL